MNLFISSSECVPQIAINYIVTHFYLDENGEIFNIFYFGGKWTASSNQSDKI